MVLWLSVLGSKISGFHLLRYKLWGLGFPKVLSNTSILWFSLINLRACSWIRMFFKVKNIWSWIWVGPPQRIWMVENQPYQWGGGMQPPNFYKPTSWEIFTQLWEFFWIWKLCQLLFITVSQFAFWVPDCERNTFVAERTSVFSDSQWAHSDLKLGVNMYRNF